MTYGLWQECFATWPWGVFGMELSILRLFRTAWNLVGDLGARFDKRNQTFRLMSCHHHGPLWLVIMLDEDEPRPELSCSPASSTHTRRMPYHVVYKMTTIRTGNG
jgi:hypothetical protein